MSVLDTVQSIVDDVVGVANARLRALTRVANTAIGKVVVVWLALFTLAFLLFVFWLNPLYALALVALGVAALFLLDIDPMAPFGG